MDVFCKCGFSVLDHDDSGCWKQSVSELGQKYHCEMTPNQVYQIYITEQQARLDTNRQQVAYLIKEKESLRNVISELRGAFHRIIGNLNNSEIVLEICDKVLRIIDNV